METASGVNAARPLIYFHFYSACFSKYPWLLQDSDGDGYTQLYLALIVKVQPIFASK